MGHRCVAVREGNDLPDRHAAGAPDPAVRPAAGTLADKRLFLLDMDGTIYLSDRLFDGTKEFLSYVRRVGGRYIFLTNNSSRGTDAYIEKLARMGVEAKPEDFLTSADVTIDLLRERYAPEQTYFVCSTESLKGQLRGAGLRVLETADLDLSAGSSGTDALPAVLLGYDTELTYEKLETCCILLGRGADYIATHPDPVCPTWYGSAPDCGSVIEMLHTATGRKPLVVGKPEPAMALAARKRTGFAPVQTGTAATGI